MPSSRLTVARPVRTLAISRRTRSIAASMRVLTSANIPFRSLKSMNHPLVGWWFVVGGLGSWFVDRCALLPSGDGRSDRLAENHLPDVSSLPQIEYDDRQLVVHA